MTIDIYDLYQRIGLGVSLASQLRVAARVIRIGPGVPNYHKDIGRVKYDGATLRELRAKGSSRYRT
jgi:hypothetical protein